LDYDRVGLQVGDPRAEVTRVLVALDLTPAVIAEASEAGAELIVTHHPLLFRPLERLTPDTLVGSMALDLVKHGISCAAAHTNLDAAEAGVSIGLAERLGLANLRVLAPTEGALLKLVVFVPADSVRAVHRAMADAGAGHIGDYSDCASETPGVGRFTPGAGTNPHIGQAGAEEQVQEVRLEMLVRRWDLPAVLRAMTEAHPYEEVAHDVYSLEQADSRVGFGAVGDLQPPLPLSQFLATVVERLGTEGLRYAGDLDSTIARVAVCGGAGADLIPRARAAGADAFVTADVTYHRYFDALTPDGSHGMAIIDAGHYETEAQAEEIIVDIIRDAFPDVDVRRTGVRTSPMRSLLA
jgi:dinuclear metal center YbgI/SA1388 family protein